MRLNIHNVIVYKVTFKMGLPFNAWWLKNIDLKIV